MSKSKKNEHQDNYNSCFAKRLRELISENKCTTSDVAENVGVSRQVISQWQNGDTQPNAEKIIKICQYFDVSANYMLGFTENKTTDVEADDISNKTGLSVENIINLISTNKFKNSIHGVENESYLKLINLIINKFKSETFSEIFYRLDKYSNELRNSRKALEILNDKDIVYYKIIKNKKILSPIQEIVLHSLLDNSITNESLEACVFRLTHLFTNAIWNFYSIDELLSISAINQNKNMDIESYISDDLMSELESKQTSIEEWIEQNNCHKQQLLNLYDKIVNTYE